MRVIHAVGQLASDCNMKLTQHYCLYILALENLWLASSHWIPAPKEPYEGYPGYQGSQNLTELQLGICNACHDIYVKMPPGNTLPTMIEGGDPTRCFQKVDSVCADCKSAPKGCQYVASESWAWNFEELLSTNFSFCRGHFADTTEQMSLTAWTRIITWRADRCTLPPQLNPPPATWTEREDFWWDYSRRAAYERQESMGTFEAQSADLALYKEENRYKGEL